MITKFQSKYSPLNANHSNNCIKNLFEYVYQYDGRIWEAELTVTHFHLLILQASKISCINKSYFFQFSIKDKDYFSCDKLKSFCFKNANNYFMVERILSNIFHIVMRKHNKDKIDMEFKELIKLLITNDQI